jgi:hypothetical protein
LLESQRPAAEKGSYPDCGSTTVTQIGQVAKSLLPVIHIVQTHTGFNSDITISLESCVASFQSAIQLLHLLRPKFDVVVRHLDPLESYARQLGVPLPYARDGAGQGKVGNQGEELVSEALAVLENTNGTDRELFRLCCLSLVGLGSLEVMSRMELMLGGRVY